MLNKECGSEGLNDVTKEGWRLEKTSEEGKPWGVWR